MFVCWLDYPKRFDWILIKFSSWGCGSPNAILVAAQILEAFKGFLSVVGHFVHFCVKLREGKMQWLHKKYSGKKSSQGLHGQ